MCVDKNICITTAKILQNRKIYTKRIQFTKKETYTNVSKKYSFEKS